MACLPPTFLPGLEDRNLLHREGWADAKVEDPGRDVSACPWFKKPRGKCRQDSSLEVARLSSALRMPAAQAARYLDKHDNVLDVWGRKSLANSAMPIPYMGSWAAIAVDDLPRALLDSQ